MDDAELDELSSMFASLQEEETKMRLSEANCVELVGKLLRRGLVERLLYTVDGSEYVTEEQLEREVLQHARDAGRVELIRLAPLLRLDLEHVERAAARLLERRSEGLQMVEGELVTVQYLEQVAHEVQEMLELQNEVSVSQLATRFQFASEFVERLVSKSLGTIIHGVLDDGVVYTEKFVRREQAKLRGALDAVTVPTPLSKLAATLGMKNTKLFHAALEDMVAKGVLRGGSVQGKIWVPRVYNCVAERFIASFFKSNGFVPFDRVAAALSAEHGMAWLRKTFPSGVSLKTCYVEPGLIEQLDAHIEDALAEGMLWVDIEPLVQFSEENIEPALLLCKSAASLRLMANRFLVSPKILDDSEKRLVVLVDGAVAMYVKSLLAKPADPLAPSAANSKKGAKKQEPKSAKDFLTMEMCVRALGAAYRNCEPELLELLCSHAMPALLRQVDEASVRLQAAAAEAKSEENHGSTRDQLSQLSADVQMLHNNMCLFYVGCNNAAVVKDEETIALMEKHIVKTTGLSLVKCLLQIEALGNHLPLAVDLSDDKERLGLIKQFPENRQQVFVALHKALSGDSARVASFQKALLACAGACQLRLKPLDKKTERTLVQGQRQGFLQQLEAVTDPALVLHLACVTLIGFRHDAILNIPSRCIPPVIESLKEILPEEAYSLLKAASLSEDKKAIDIGAIKAMVQANIKVQKKK